MTQSVTELFDAALALSEPERAELVELLLATVGGSSGLHPAWGAELRRRVAEVVSGQVKPIPWDDVRREARSRLDADVTGSKRDCP